MRRKKNIKVFLKELGERLNAEQISSGNEEIEIEGLATLEEAGEDQISFVGSEKLLGKAEKCLAGAFIVPPGLVIEQRPCLQVENVWKAVIQVLDIFYPDEKQVAGIHPSAVVDESVQLGVNISIGPKAVIEENVHIGDNVEIGPQCFIGRGVKVGEGTRLYPNVTIHERISVGRNVIIHSGTVLGTDGFKYEVIDGQPCKIPQVGAVVIEDQVEIGANTCIDRAFLGETRIGYGTKIDNLVQVGHNCRIGKFNAMAAGVGFSGSVTTGMGCIFWGQAGIREQLNIGDGTVVNAQSGIAQDLPAGSNVLGSPAQPTRETARQHAALKRLPDLIRRVKRLEKNK